MVEEVTNRPNFRPTAVVFVPRVSIVVPFFGLPVLWVGSHNRVFGQPKKGTTMETLGSLGGFEIPFGSDFGALRLEA